MEEFPPFAVAHQHVPGPDFRNHGAGYSAGVGAFIFIEDVLGPVADAVFIHHGRYAFQGSERREQHHFSPGHFRAMGHLVSQFHGFRHGLVAFPVAGHNGSPQIIQGSQAGQHFAFQVFQGSTAAGGYMAHLVGQAHLLHSGCTVAAAHDGDAVRSGHGFCHPPGPFRIVGHFEHTHGPVPHNGLHAGQGPGIQFCRFGADIQGHVVRVQGIQVFCFMVRLIGEAGGHDQIHRQEHFGLLGCGFRQQILGDSQAFLFHQGFPQVVAFGRQEGVGHAAPDQDHVSLFDQAADHGDLVRHFSPADDGGKGTLGFVHGIAQVCDFLFQQETGHGGQVVGNGFHGSMGPVGYPEPVVHIYIPQSRQFLGKMGVILFFFRMEPEVFQQQDIPVPQLGSCILGILAHAVRAELHRTVDQLAQGFRHGLQGELGVHLAFGTAQVSHQDHCGSLIQQVVEGGQRGFDADEIRDFPFVVHGNVVVYPDQHPFAGQLNIFNGFFIHVSVHCLSLTGPFWPRTEPVPPDGWNNPIHCRTRKPLWPHGDPPSWWTDHPQWSSGGSRCSLWKPEAVRCSPGSLSWWFQKRLSWLH